MEIWENEKWKTLNNMENPFGTLAFQYGFGLFETVLVQKGGPVDLDEHIQRLSRSMNQLDSKSFLDMRQLREKVLFSMDQSEKTTKVLKIIAYREEEQWKTMLLTRGYTYNGRDYEKGFSLKKSACFRNPKSFLVYHKTLNYLENYLERQKARQMGYDDAYFVNTAGIITECSTANIFIVYEDKLITSPVQEGLLPGIMRMKLLENVEILGLSAEEIPIQEDMLLKAKMVLITNALLGVMPVFRVDDTPYSFDQSLIERVNQVLDRGVR